MLDIYDSTKNNQMYFTATSGAAYSVLPSSNQIPQIVQKPKHQVPLSEISEASVFEDEELLLGGVGGVYNPVSSGQHVKFADDDFGDFDEEDIRVADDEIENLLVEAVPSEAFGDIEDNVNSPNEGRF